MPIIISDLISKNDGLFHYTNSDYLNLILKEGYVSMKAPCINRYWNIPEANSHDDNSELIMSLYELLKSRPLKICPRTNEQRLKRINCAEIFKEEYGAIPTIVSTLTPYLICFSLSGNDEKLFQKFGNSEYGQPVMLKFNPKVISENSTRYEYPSSEEPLEVNTDENEREELFEIQYAKSLDSKDIEIAYDYVYNKIKNTLSSDNLPDDDRIDACFYVKQDKYSDESEARYIFRRNEFFAFGKIDNDKLEFVFDEGTDDKDKHLLVKFDKSSLQELRFGPGVDLKTAKEVIEDIEYIKEYPHTKICLFDGSTIL